MSEEPRDNNQSDIIWKGSTVLLTIILALALVSWVSERKNLIAKSAKRDAGKFSEHGDNSRKLDAQRQKTDVAQAALIKVSKENEALRNRIENLRGQLDKIGAIRGTLSERVASASEDKVGLLNKLQKAHASMAAIEKSQRSLKADFVRVEEHRNSLLRQRKRWQAQESATTKDLRTIQTELNQKNQTCGRLQRELDSLNRQMKKADNNLRQCQAALANAQKTQKVVGQLRKKLIDEEQEIRRLKGVLDSKRQQFEEINREVLAQGLLLSQAKSDLKKAQAEAAESGSPELLREVRMLRAKDEKSQLVIKQIDLDRGALIEELKRAKKH